VNRSTATRIVVIDRHTMFAECLCLVLGQRGHHAVHVAPPSRAGSLGVQLAPILRERPEIVIVDIARSGGHDGISLVQPLTLARLHVVVVTAETDPALWGQALSLGARVVLSKEAPLTSIAGAVRRLHEGLRTMDVEQRRELVNAYRAQSRELGAERERLGTLSGRESEILSHLLLGQAVAEIARLSFVSEATVRTQVKSVLTKLGVSSQLAAVAMARRTRWIPCDVVRSDRTSLHTPAAS
jgi:DNA-binding NarL/FixJ family response regulator